ncbi:partitioning defective protein 6-like [Paramacrobiotus metropolitanus]|uniref:partitioning defective protein 6-like n=1 Tax=Paramacrobiotus metropolitanus TaxID=2943436 RepID=UPI002445A16D|nr:partitioning defective protein 6-like [Paramacrobiotus metropolitanus]
MSKKGKDFNSQTGANLVEIKSKFDAEFRRFSLNRLLVNNFEDFHKSLEALHGLSHVPFVVFYTDKEGDLLPINNNDNFAKALSTTRTQSILRIFVQRKDENWSELIGYSTINRRKEKGKSLILAPLSSNSANKAKGPLLKIGMPEDFRQVSAIIDVDILPQTHRRVRLLKHGSDRPLGFYIRDGTSIRMTHNGLEKIPGIFISRLVPGGLAESTGLLSVNDEVIEVNGIEVANKTLDQVTDMMIANSSNLIVTVKPANLQLRTTNKSPSNSDVLSDAQSKSYNSPATRNGPQRSSQMSASAASTSSYPSNTSYNTDDDEVDEIRDLTVGLSHNASGSSGTGSDRVASANAHRGSDKKLKPRPAQHVTKIVLDGKNNNGIIHGTEQVFTL